VRTYDLVTVARMFKFVREAQAIGQNRGLWVEAIQHAAGGTTADSWCMEMLWCWFAIAYQGSPPFDRMQACEDFHVLALKRGWVVPPSAVAVGDVALTVNESGHAHHVALVTEIAPLTTIAGNTSSDGVSSNGDRVAEHVVGTAGKVFVRVPA
jgi:hypothetical protein